MRRPSAGRQRRFVPYLIHFSCYLSGMYVFSGMHMPHFLTAVLLAGLALCPIFLNVRRFRMVQFLIPTFLYLHGIRSGEFILYLAGYTVLSWSLGLLLAWTRGTEEPGEA